MKLDALNLFLVNQNYCKELLFQLVKITICKYLKFII